MKLDAAAAGLLKEAAEWRLLGLLFEYPAEPWSGEVRALLTSLDDPAMREMGEAALRDASPGLHIALFGPGGTVKVREVTHRGGVQFGYLMAELAAIYEAFGYEPRIEEAADHLAVQLGFMGYLKFKQAHALCGGEEEHAKVTAEAAESFRTEHLAVQATPVLEALEEFAPEYLVEAGRRMREKAGPPPKSAYPLSALPAAGLEEEEMSCGSAVAADDLVRIQP